MKRVKTTAKRFAGLTFLSLSMSAFLITGCDNGAPEDSEKVAEEQNEERLDDRKSEKDAEFLVEAAAINMEEIKLGELAQQKGTIKEVKDLGKAMVEAHTAALDQLKQLAEEKSITLPGSLTEDGQEAYDKLNKKTGKDFNNEYCQMMVKGHETAISKFEKASSDAEDMDIRNWAASMLPALRTHLEHATMCEEKCKSMK